MTRTAFELQAWEIVLGGAVAAGAVGLFLWYTKLKEEGWFNSIPALGGTSSWLAWLLGSELADDTKGDKEMRSARDIIEDMIRRKGGGP